MFSLPFNLAKPETIQSTGVGEELYRKWLWLWCFIAWHLGFSVLGKERTSPDPLGQIEKWLVESPNASTERFSFLPPPPWEASTSKAP